MKEIDIMLEKWIHSSIIRDQLRKLIAEEIAKERIKILTWDNQLKNKR